MSAHKSWLRRLAKLDEGLPWPPAGAPYWLKSFEVVGAELGLANREPDFATALAIYRATVPPYGTEEAVRLHDHLLELGLRALDGVPPCSAAEFAELTAWLAEHGPSLPTVNGWKKDLEVGDGTTATLPGLTWRVVRRGEGRRQRIARGDDRRHTPASPQAKRRADRTSRNWEIIANFLDTNVGP